MKKAVDISVLHGAKVINGNSNDRNHASERSNKLHKILPGPLTVLVYAKLRYTDFIRECF